MTSKNKLDDLINPQNNNQKKNESKVKKFKKTVIRVIHGIIEFVIRGLLHLIYRGPGESMPPIKDLILLESATSLAYKIRTKKLKSSDVVESFITRIQEINPLLNCVIAPRFEEARAEAKKVDDLIESNVFTEEILAKEKPFFGVPFTTKDGIAVKDMPHTSGLYKRRNIVATEDGDAIGLLRKAGAIPLALTNIPELCMWWETGNVIYGRTNNPYDTTRIVGGSSGGEGCNQAAAGTAFGVGSDIGGSIRMPAFFNGVFGHKPSPGIVSIKGQYPIPTSDEQRSFLGIGPMCRRAEDLLPILKIISDKKAVELRLDDPVDVSKIRFFYQENDTGSKFVSPVSLDIKLALRDVIKYLEKTHKIKAQKTHFTQFDKSADLWFANMKAEHCPKFQEQLANCEGSINVSWELLKWCVGQSNHTFIVLMTAIVENLGIQYGTPKYEYLVQVRNNFKRDLIQLLGDDGVLIYPTHPTAAPYHHEPIYKPLNFSYTGIINVLQLPATACPLGLGSEGLPIGIQVVAAPNQDRLCLAVARELEKAFGGWVPPPILA
ncbi:fatty-acid amide hydrolase 2 [Chrysoperla carnea]|uniref:fatty-acid amide hydrolase 2 n=1 Tax=Chrysoperla carnea TaxID=189513 RepID=UPI001D0724C1|nr:fatty-acid amide hydrolase 2 [Chrysoperla carnea]